MSEETRRILDMVKNNVITEEEGEKLIEALYEKEKPRKNTTKKSTLRVRIESEGSDKHDKSTVNVNIPLTLAKKVSGLTSFVPKKAKVDLTAQGIDLDSFDLVELIDMFESGEIEEDLVNIDVGDGDDLTKVRVYVD